MKKLHVVILGEGKSSSLIDNLVEATYLSSKILDDAFGLIFSLLGSLDEFPGTVNLLSEE